MAVPERVVEVDLVVDRRLQGQAPIIDAVASEDIAIELVGLIRPVVGLVHRGIGDGRLTRPPTQAARQRAEVLGIVDRGRLRGRRSGR